MLGIYIMQTSFFLCSWEQSSSSSVYRKAVASCIKDVLDEYMGDIVYLEQQILESGPVPFSHLTHHFQKVIFYDIRIP